MLKRIVSGEIPPNKKFDNLTKEETRMIEELFIRGYIIVISGGETMDGRYHGELADAPITEYGLDFLHYQF